MTTNCTLKHPFTCCVSEPLKLTPCRWFSFNMTPLPGIFKLPKLKFHLTLLLILICAQAISQTSKYIDLKNSLYDLKAQLLKSKTDTERVSLALKTASFYITNKADLKTMFDSSRKYVSIAEALSNEIHYEKGQTDVQLLKVHTLLVHDSVGKVLKMISGSSGTIFCQMHFILGRYYLTQEGNLKSNLDSADAHFKIAQQYADKNHFPNISLNNRVSRYNVMLALGLAPGLCEPYFSNIIALCKTYQNKLSEEKAVTLRIAYSNPPDVWKKLTDAARAAGDKAKLAAYLKNLADANLQNGKLDTAENQLQMVIKIYTEIGYKNLQYTYDLMSAVAIAKGNTTAAIRYGLAAVKYAEQSGTDNNLDEIYQRLAVNYLTIGLTKQSDFWNQKSMEVTLKLEERPTTPLINDLIKKGKARLAIKIIDSALKKYPKNYGNTFFSFFYKGDCYAALGQIKNAENSYLQARVYMIKTNSFQMRTIKFNNFMADFYIRQNAFEKAAPFLDTLFKLPKQKIEVPDLLNLYTFESKVDSARGHYLEALKYFEASKKLSDSLLDQARQKQSEQLALQYNTAVREHENLVLRNNNTIQQSELEKDSFQRRIITTGLVSAVLIIGVMIYLYHAKQQSNKILKSSQKKINLQNSRLNTLLLEKEWLIKEIHHRVRNNLHIITSLINTQLSFLDNKQAKEAINDCQNRIHSIAIVHKKLYQSEDLATINLNVYIEELAYSIIDSFPSKHPVKLEIKVENTKLTSDQTVPLGLILNEAITNSVKYAFTEGQRGTVSISFRELPGEWYELVIRDNGRGLPENFNINSYNSLGLNVIRGLTKQLSGKFEIHSDSGTKISIQFPHINPAILEEALD